MFSRGLAEICWLFPSGATTESSLLLSHTIELHVLWLRPDIKSSFFLLSEPSSPASFHRQTHCPSSGHGCMYALDLIFWLTSGPKGWQEKNVEEVDSQTGGGRPGGGSGSCSWRSLGPGARLSPADLNGSSDYNNNSELTSACLERGRHTLSRTDASAAVHSMSTPLSHSSLQNSCLSVALTCGEWVLSPAWDKVGRKRAEKSE